MQRTATIFELDDPDTLALVQADPRQLVQGPRPSVIDEWQRLPSCWDLVRRAVDNDPTAGQFILTGSAPPLTAPTHTGAGRIVTVRMRPLALAERWDSRAFLVPTVSLAALLDGQRADVTGRSQARLADYVTEILAGGFPAFRLQPPRTRRASLGGYVRRIVERDFPEAGHRIRNPVALRNWMRGLRRSDSDHGLL